MATVLNISKDICPALLIGPSPAANIQYHYIDNEFQGRKKGDCGTIQYRLYRFFFLFSGSKCTYHIYKTDLNK